MAVEGNLLSPACAVARPTAATGPPGITRRRENPGRRRTGGGFRNETPQRDARWRLARQAAGGKRPSLGEGGEAQAFPDRRFTEEELLRPGGNEAFAASLRTAGAKCRRDHGRRTRRHDAKTVSDAKRHARQTRTCGEPISTGPGRIIVSRHNCLNPNNRRTYRDKGKIRRP